MLNLNVKFKFIGLWLEWSIWRLDIYIMCRRESETKNILYVGGGGNFLVIQVAPRDMNSELDHHIFAVRARVRRETTDFGEDHRVIGERPQTSERTTEWSELSTGLSEPKERSRIQYNYSKYICNKLNIWLSCYSIVLNLCEFNVHYNLSIHPVA